MALFPAVLKSVRERAPSPTRDIVKGVQALERTVAELEIWVVLRYGSLYGPGTVYAFDGLMADLVRRGQVPADEGVTSFLKENGRGASQRLQTRRAGIPSPIIADFGQQARGQTFSCSRQTAEDLVVFMAQKKLLDLLLIGGNLLYQRQQLSNKSQGQARFRPGGDRGSSQARLMQVLENARGHFRGCGVTSRFEKPFDLFDGGSLCHLQSRIGLQEDQTGVLLQLGKEGKCHRVILASGRP